MNYKDELKEFILNQFGIYDSIYNSSDILDDTFNKFDSHNFESSLVFALNSLADKFFYSTMRMIQQQCFSCR
jgi:hypothetical protein